MSTNKAEQTLEKRLINDIEELKRQVREIKTVQRIGGDVLTTIASGLVTSGPVTTAAGLGANFNITVTPGSPILTLWNYLFTVYVDVLDAAHEFPNGASLTADQRKLTIMNWIDWANSSDITNIRLFKIRVRNDDSVSHDYYIKFKIYIPEIQGTA